MKDDTPTSYLYLGWTCKPRSIIDVRLALNSLAHDIEQGLVTPGNAAMWLRTIAESARRKSPISVAPERIRPLSEGVKEAVRAEHRARPHLSQLELAQRFNTNPGRISEALNEFRT